MYFRWILVFFILASALVHELSGERARELQKARRRRVCVSGSKTLDNNNNSMVRVKLLRTDGTLFKGNLEGINQNLFINGPKHRTKHYL